MKKVLHAFIGMLICVGVLFTLAGCPQPRDTIIVASKIDTEGGLLGRIIILLLEADGFSVDDRTQFGTTDVIRTAIASGEIDIYPEYTGNVAFFYPGEEPDSVWQNPDEAYAAAVRLDAEYANIVWLERSPANNTWAIAVRNDLAESAGLVTLSDLGAYISGGGEFKLAASEEFITRSDVLPAFEQAYGFSLSDDQLLSFSGGNTALTEQAAADQTEGVNAAMAYGTDGQLAAFGLTVLIDDQGVQPIYQPAPAVRAEVIEKYPEIRDILAPVFQTLDLVTLQGLNSSIVVDGRDIADVAREYLETNGFL